MKESSIGAVLNKIASYKIDPFYLYSGLITIILFYIQFDLYWPGYIQDDSQTTFLLDKAGWHPAVMAYLVQIMYFFFGIHIYHLFLLTLIPFYSSILIIVNLAYIKSKSWWSLILFFPCFITNVFYPEIRLGSSSFSTSWLLLLYTLTLYIVIKEYQFKNKIKYLFSTIYVVVFLIALLSRHNAIISVWPITFVWIALCLRSYKINIWKYLIYFASCAFVTGCSCLVLLFEINYLLEKSDYELNQRPDVPIILHQITGACAPALDETCFDKTWWKPKWNKNQDKMKKLKEKYEKYTLNSEPFIVRNKADPFFKTDIPLEGLQQKWFYAITKYPQNYFNHQMSFLKAFWFLPADIIPKKRLTEYFDANRMLTHVKLWHLLSEKEKTKYYDLAKKVPDSERSIKWTVFQNALDTMIRYIYPSFNMFLFVLLNFVLCIFSAFIFIKNRQNLLFLLMFSTSCAGVLNSLIIPLLGPIIYSRYMEPVVLCGYYSVQLLILALLSGNLNIKKGLKYVK